MFSFRDELIRSPSWSKRDGCTLGGETGAAGRQTEAAEGVELRERAEVKARRLRLTETLATGTLIAIRQIVLFCPASSEFGKGFHLF